MPLEISAVTSLSPPPLFIIPDVLLNRPLRAQDESLDNEYWGMLTQNTLVDMNNAFCCVDC